MNRIVLIQPYFGKFPEYFPLHLLTVKNNPEVTWIFFTDDKTGYNWPENTQVHYLNFEEMQKYIASKFDFKIKLDQPYKLCDFKLAYGYIFSEYIKGYDFWGHCDVDILWGNIGGFLTSDILNNYDFLFRTGHFRLYRNIEKMNMFFTSPQLQFGYKNIFSHSENYCLDEMNSTQRELLQAGFRYYDNDNLEADIDPFQSGLKLREVSDTRRKYMVFRTRKNYPEQIFSWEAGRIFRYFIDGDKISRDEFIDIHFLKRKMKLEGKINPETNKVLITPTRFIPDFKELLTKDKISELANDIQGEELLKGKAARFFSSDKKLIKLRKKWYDMLIKLNLK